MTPPEVPDSAPPRSLAEWIFLSPGECRLRAGRRLLIEAILFAFFAAAVVFLIFPLLPEGRIFWLVEELTRLLAVVIPVHLARRLLDRRSFTSLGLRLYREQISSLYTFAYGLYRPNFLSLGRHFTARGLLSNPTDIFLLEPE